MEKRRMSYIDIGKGIGIFLVVLGHTYRRNIVQNWLYSFHMPLFFFISGWLFCGGIDKKDYVKFIAKKARGLLLPYAVFLILNFLYWLVVERHFRSFDQGPLWYLPVLFVVECVVATVVIWIGNRKWLFNMFMVSFGIGLICIGLLDGVFEYKGMSGWIIRCYNGIFWYYAGFWLARYIKQWIEVTTNRKNSLILIVVLFTLSIISGCSNGRVDMYGNLFNNIFLYIFAAFAGISLCMELSVFLGKNRALEYFGKNSLIILCTHEPIKRAVIQVGSMLLKTPTETIRNNILVGAVIAMIVALIEVVAIEILHSLSRSTKGKKIHFLFEYIK